MTASKTHRLYLALSCLQGRPMGPSFDELAALTGAIQLTPGNHPTSDFEAHTTKKKTRVLTRRHHGFDFALRKREVWSSDATCLVPSESVHPPMSKTEAAKTIMSPSSGLGLWLESIRSEDATSPLLETMYPDYVLGSGEEIELAMEIGVKLAVDVSHVFMQIAQGVMNEGTWERLREYPNIGEVHLSANDGRHDLHAPLTTRTFGLAWAQTKLAEGTPVVLECYMHRLTDDHRRRQVALATGDSMTTMTRTSDPTNAERMIQA
jgi:hypothetical protein